MVTRKVKIGFQNDGKVLSYIKERKLMSYFRDKENFDGRLFFTLTDYLIKYSKMFDKFSLYFDVRGSANYFNGTLVGLIKKINQSKVDIGIQSFVMDEIKSKAVDFSYPYQLYYATFITRKPENTPQPFGILQTLSVSTWMTVTSVFAMILFLCYMFFEKRYSLDKISLHLFAVLLRQNSILKPFYRAENLLVYAWVVGAMFLCWAYESVFFSFLAVPPVSQIKDVSQLARVVERGEYECVANRVSGVYSRLLQSQHENLKIIGNDLKRNNLSTAYKNIYEDLFRKRKKRNLAFILYTELAAKFSVGEDFVSDDRFLETMAAMMVRKDFCCKRLLERFVHKMMASGLYFKYYSDSTFLFRLPFLLNYTETDASERKLTLIDVAPAFIFLLTGYFISIVTFFGEILSKKKKSL